MLALTSEDGETLGVIDKMAVTELIKKGQSVDNILKCLKVCYMYLVEYVCFVCKCKNRPSVFTRTM